MLIVTASDDNYVPGVLVLIASAAHHNPEARFAVLDSGITPANRDRIDRLATHLGVEIARIEVGGDSFAALPLQRRHLTRSAYLRFLIPDLLPAESRVIYMDCDMVVTDDLSELDTTSFDSALLLAVPDPSPDRRDVRATGMEVGTYLNSGLLVMNLDAWRAEDVAGQCIATLSAPEGGFYCEDQSAINIVCRGRIRYLDPRFNVYCDPNAYKRVEDLPMRPAVLHYVVNNKPWNYPTTLSAVWRWHAARIASVMPPLRVPTWKRRVSMFNRQRKIWVGLALRRPKYLNQRWMRRMMNETIAPAYIAAQEASVQQDQ